MIGPNEPDGRDDVVRVLVRRGHRVYLWRVGLSLVLCLAAAAALTTGAIVLRARHSASGSAGRLATGPSTSPATPKPSTQVAVRTTTPQTTPPDPTTAGRPSSRSAQSRQAAAAPGPPQQVAIRWHVTVGSPAPSGSSGSLLNRTATYPVDVTWVPPSTGGEVDEYQVLRDGVVLATRPALDSPVVQLQLADRTVHSYQVRAQGPGGSSPAPPQEYPLRPNPPGPLTFDSLPDGSLMLTWSPPVSGGEVVGYLLDRDGTQIAETPADPKPHFTDAGSLDQRTYVVIAFGLGGEASGDATIYPPQISVPVGSSPLSVLASSRQSAPISVASPTTDTTSTAG